jgi:molybdate transport system substrate-binding protein
VTRRPGRIAGGLRCAILLALAGAAPSCGAATGPDATVSVFAAASLADAFTEIGRLFERRNPRLAVRFNFAGSQQLATQIEQGAVADVFAAADEQWMEYARERGLLAGEPLVFARNRLVVIVPKANPARITRLQDLARDGVKLVIGAGAVPVGRYSRTMLANLARDSEFGGEFAARALRNVVSEEENVRSIVGKVQLGEADAGIVYRSDVTPAVAGKVRTIGIPEGANATASYPIARVMGAKAPDAAAAFVELVLSQEGQRILERHGLLPRPALLASPPALSR